MKFNYSKTETKQFNSTIELKVLAASLSSKATTIDWTPEECKAVEVLLLNSTEFNKAVQTVVTKYLNNLYNNCYQQ